MYVGTRDRWMHNLKHPLGEGPITEIPAGCELPPDPPIGTLAELDQHELHIYVSKPLHELIDRISVTANVYEVAVLELSDIYFSDADAPWWPDPEWWPDLAPDARSFEWVEITKATHLPFPEYLPDRPLLIDYYRHLPTRLPS
jgi:hypothetical protein